MKALGSIPSTTYETKKLHWLSTVPWMSKVLNTATKAFKTCVLSQDYALQSVWKSFSSCDQPGLAVPSLLQLLTFTEHGLFSPLQSLQCQLKGHFLARPSIYPMFSSFTLCSSWDMHCTCHRVYLAASCAV